MCSSPSEHRLTSVRRHPPRALLLATGEEVPSGQSLRTRMLVFEVAPGGVDRKRLNGCKQATQQGYLASAMAAFSQLDRRPAMRKRRASSRRGFKNYGIFTSRAAHARLPRTRLPATVQSGLEIWAAICAPKPEPSASTEYSQLEQRNVRALHELAALQTKFHLASDSALRFLSLLRVALSSGQAHVADRSGKTPESPECWGWQREQTHRSWVAHGPRVGWLAGGDLFLDPSLSYQVVQQMAGAERVR